MRIISDVKLDFKDVLIRPKRSNLKSRREVQLERTYCFARSKQTWTGVPIMAANMDTTGTFAMAEEFAEHKMIVCLHKWFTGEEIRQWAAKMRKTKPTIFKYIAVSAGVSDRDFNLVKGVLSTVPEIQFICLDVANGYAQFFIQTVRKYRVAFPGVTIIAGNVVTGEMVEELILSGADIIKVGIGPGSVCTTRRQTGVGYPQLSAVIECADAAHGLRGHIISDGGCACPGDFAKAFGGGADFIMAGGMFAGHDESGGKIITRDGQLYKRFYGMSSTTAMQKHSGKVANYRSSEGKSVEVPYRGPVRTTILDILGGIRSTCTYVGARHLKELSKRTTFVRVSGGKQLNSVFDIYKDTSRKDYTECTKPAAPAAAADTPPEKRTRL